jgi:hypothetical protein
MISGSVGLARPATSRSRQPQSRSELSYPPYRLTLQRRCRLAYQFHGLLMLQAFVQAATEMANTPAREGQYDHAELSPSICQFVSRPGGMVGIELSTYQTMRLESLEAARKHIGSDAG